MNNTNTGGPAFPLHSEVRPALDTEWCGMTLRDYFAAKALLVGGSVMKSPAYDDATRAKYAYELADAMLKARGH